MMGACTFMTRGKGKTARDAFLAATNHAKYMHGHGGYSGTIAEKHEFVNIVVPNGEDPFDHASKLIEQDDRRISDKWGPAGCIDLGDGEFLFFGWASS